MRRSAILALVGALLAACSTTAPVSNPHLTFAHKQVVSNAWIDPPQVGAAAGVAPGAPNPPD
jgi:hypothetical protein